MTLQILSAGAAQGVVTRLAAQLGVTLDARFGAVGAMQEQFESGAPCDLIILTRRQMDALRARGEVSALEDLGRVRTGVAVRRGDPRPEIGTADALRAALLAADEVFHPDAIKATAGIHFAKVVASLGIADALAGRLRPYPNGATAMRELAASRAARAIGCTQITEILNTEGCTLAGPLPREFELATTYTAGLRSARADAEDFFRRLTGRDLAELRASLGFET